MIVFRVIILIAVALIVLAFVGLYGIFRQVFGWSGKVRKSMYDIPDGEQYQEQREYMLSLIRDVAAVPYESVSITAKDGIRLAGKYYHNQDGAPVEIMFHGYHGVAEREFCGQFRICKAMGHNALLVDQRAHGSSEGNVTTFGAREKEDCLKWVQYVIERFGDDVEILLCGISMGASTVLLTASMDLPPNVKGIAADCGFDSTKNIICNVIEKKGLPVRKVYPIVRAAAKLYGHFDPDQTSAAEALRRAKVPILLIHGEADRFVPCEMSRNCFEACASKNKYLLTVPKAGHGISYILDKEKYVEMIRMFSSCCFKKDIEIDIDLC